MNEETMATGVETDAPVANESEVEATTPEVEAPTPDAAPAEEAAPEAATEDTPVTGDESREAA